MSVPVIASTIATTTAMMPRYSTAVWPLSLRAARACRYATVVLIQLLMVFPSGSGRPFTGRRVRLCVVGVTGFLLAGAAVDTRNVRRNTPPAGGSQGPIKGPIRDPAAPPYRHHGSPQPSARTGRCAEPLGGRLGAAGAVEFGEDAVDVVLDRLLADEAGGGDLLVV